MKNKIKFIILNLMIIMFVSIIININVNANEINTDINIIEKFDNISKNLFGDVTVDSIEYLYNLDESPDYIYVRFKGTGYAIFSSYTLDVLEYSVNSELPYDSFRKKYYAGPMNYIDKKNDKFVNINYNKVISDDKVDSIVDNVKCTLNQLTLNDDINELTEDNLYEIHSYLQNNSKTRIDNYESLNSKSIVINEAKYIDNYEYFMIGPYHGENESGTCTAVAAQLLLGYHNYYNDRRIIDDMYLFDGENNPNICQNPMKTNSYIIGTRGLNEDGMNDKDSTNITNSYFVKVLSVIPAGSNSQIIKSGIMSLLEERKNDSDEDLADLSVGNDLSMIKNEIDDGRPIIISMDKDGDNGISDHAVVGYGYQYLEQEEKNQLGYFVHMGWSTSSDWSYKTNVWISQSWCYSWVKMVPTHSHQYGQKSGIYCIRECNGCGHRISDFDFTTAEVDNKIIITGMNSDVPNDLIIPSKINDKTVVGIAQNAFNGKENLESLVLPNTIENIGIGAFSGCSSLQNLIIPFTGSGRNSNNQTSHIGYIFGTQPYTGSYAISQNNVTYYIPTSLTNVSITGSQIIKANSFKNCNKIETIRLGSNLTKIENDAFYGCTLLSNIKLPTLVNHIGEKAFYNCVSLDSENFDLPKYVFTIGDEAFYGCNNITQINLPKNVTFIGDNAFRSDINIIWNYNPLFSAADLGITSNLIVVNIDKSVNSIKEGAFKNCLNLTDIIIEENVSSIGKMAFDGCTYLDNVQWYYNSKYTLDDLGGNLKDVLTHVEISNDATVIESCNFNDCINLKEFKIHERVSKMDDVSFANCNSMLNVIWNYNPVITAGNLNINQYLTEINLSHKVEEEDITVIKEYAFDRCTKLENINIPINIINIKSYAFANCSNLKTIIIPNNLINIEENCFSNCTSLSSIIVPKEQFLVYKNLENLINFKDNIISNEEIETIEVHCVGLRKPYYLEKGEKLIKRININCDSIFSLNIESNFELYVSLYNDDFELISDYFIENDNLQNCLNISLISGVYYIDISYLNDENIGNIQIFLNSNIQEDGYETYLNEEYDISNHLHELDNKYKSYIKYNHLSNNGLYKISLNNVNNLDSGSIIIYTDNERTNVLESYNINNFENNAISKINDNCLYVYLHYNTTYYITITLSEYQSGSLLIEDIPNTFELSIFNQTNIMSGEAVNILNLSDDLLNYSYFKKLVIKETGLFNTVISYNGTQTTNIKVLLIKKNFDNEYINLSTFTLNNLSSTINYPYRILENGTYYIGYYNLDKSKCDNINVSFSRFVDNDSDSVYNGLLVDPNAPGMYGTQIGIVEKNTTNKSYGETYITKGFTRLIFIDGSFGYQTSRTSYAWYSSDESVLSVTNYGTVLGKSEGTAKVIGVNKDNPSIIFVKEFTIIDNIDEEIHIIEINQTYDINSNDELILNLNASNCPYPYIQYYEFEIIECVGDTYLNAFGRIITNTPVEIVVEGVYTLNRNYIVRLIINVT